MREGAEPGRRGEGLDGVGAELGWGRSPGRGGAQSLDAAAKLRPTLWAGSSWVQWRGEGPAVQSGSGSVMARGAGRAGGGVEVTLAFAPEVTDAPWCRTIRPTSHPSGTGAALVRAQPSVPSLGPARGGWRPPQMRPDGEPGAERRGCCWPPQGLAGALAQSPALGACGTCRGLTCDLSVWRMCRARPLPARPRQPRPAWRPGSGGAPRAHPVWCWPRGSPALATCRTC